MRPVRCWSFVNANTTSFKFRTQFKLSHKRKVGYASPKHILRVVEIRDEPSMIRRLKSGGYRLYSRKRNPKTGKRRNLGTFPSLAAAEKHERAVQFFKRKG